MDNIELTNAFVDSILAGKAVEAQAQLNDILALKTTSAIEAHKQEVAQSIYAAAPEETTDDAPEETSAEAEPSASEPEPAE